MKISGFRDELSPRRFRCGRRSRGGFRRSIAGQGIVELALTIPIFLVLFFGIFEFSRYYSTRLSIRTAVSEGARYAATGSELIDPDTGDALGRANSIRTVILSKVARFGVDAADIALTPADGGGPEEIVTVSLDYDYAVAVPMVQRVLGRGTLAFSVSTSMRNEPFFE